MQMKRLLLMLMLALSIGASMAIADQGHVAQYNSVTGLLEISQVSIDGRNQTYSVTLQNRALLLGEYLFDLDQGTVTLNNAGGFGAEQQPHKPPCDLAFHLAALDMEWLSSIPLAVFCSGPRRCF
jgi:hypothetical protein